MIIFKKIHTGDTLMNTEIFNMETRKFLKKVGVTSQSKIEAAVNAAIEDGRLKGDETLNANMVLNIGGIDLTFEIEGDIKLS